VPLNISWIGGKTEGEGDGQMEGRGGRKRREEEEGGRGGRKRREYEEE
jgi:hypothetical protein